MYRREATLWGNEPGDSGVRFFPIGRAAPQPVDIFVVQNGQARPVLYSPALFDMPADSPARRLGSASGFAGFETDWLAFLGASYWRSSDPLNQYGLSTRGLAIDTATAGPEEFPVFTAFWLEHDATNQLVVHALLESPSAAGAYRIVNRRSPAGLVQEIDAHLRFRKPVARLGVAPLTSMYWYEPEPTVRRAMTGGLRSTTPTDCRSGRARASASGDRWPTRRGSSPTRSSTARRAASA